MNSWEYEEVGLKKILFPLISSGKEVDSDITVTRNLHLCTPHFFNDTDSYVWNVAQFGVGVHRLMAGLALRRSWKWRGS